MRLVFLFLICLPYLLPAQCERAEYRTIIQLVQEDLDNRKYQRAINRLLYVRDICPDEKTDINNLIKQAFDQIEDEKAAVERERARADSALDVARRVLNQMYFYQGKYGLSLKDVGGGNFKYGFINRDGRELIRFKFDLAEPFSQMDGFARVKINEEKYLLDTMGTTYRLAESLEELKSREVEALDLTKTPWDSLPEDIGKYKDLKILLLGRRYVYTTGKPLKRLPPSFTQLTKLQYLDLNYAQLRYLPEDFGKLESLEFLDLEGVGLAELPFSFGKLVNLKRAHLFKNYLKQLPDNMGQLQKLTYLNLAENFLEQLPQSIGQMKQLKDVNLRKNKLTRLPMSFSQLKNLRDLDLRANQLRSLPTGFGGWPHLQQMFLNDNHLISLPEDIGSAKQLKNLGLTDNQLRSLPQSLASLTQLKRLSVSRNQLRELPEKIGQLTKLNTLELDQNLLKTLPESLPDMEELWQLNLENNQLEALPASIWHMNNLSVVKLAHNRLSSLAMDFAKLPLQEIDLSHNAFVTFPEALCQMEYIWRVNISHNSLVSLPDRIDNLKNLIELDVSQNNIQSLPPQLASCDKLQILNLSQNQLTSIPELFSQMTNVTSLHLGNNQIRDLPESLSALTRLNSLNLSNNALMEIPSVILQMRGLRQLYVQHNQLQSLPDSLDKNYSLDDLDISHNPLNDIPPVVGRLSQLRTLSMRDIGITQLLDTFACKFLFQIDLRDNQIQHLPPSLGQIFPSLNHIDLRGNALQELSPDLCYRLTVEIDDHQLPQLMNTCLPEWQKHPSQGVMDTWFAKLEKQGEVKLAYQYLQAVSTIPHMELRPLTWYKRSWFALFNGEYDDAVISARRTLELEPRQEKVETNMALGYLLGDRFEEAKAVYLKWKGKRFYSDPRLAEEIFLKDLDDLEAFGITHPDFDKIRQMLRE